MTNSDVTETKRSVAVVEFIPQRQVTFQHCGNYMYNVYTRSIRFLVVNDVHVRVGYRLATKVFIG